MSILAHLAPRPARPTRRARRSTGMSSD